MEKSISPTEKQIAFVEKICYTLGIDDFPSSSTEFTKYHFNNFIKTHLYKYNSQKSDIVIDLETLYDYCVNDVWCEHY